MKKIVLTMFVAASALLAQSTAGTTSTAGTAENGKGSAINGTQGIHTAENAKGDVYQSNNTNAPGNAGTKTKGKKVKRGKNNGDTSGSASTRENEHSNASTPH